MLALVNDIPGQTSQPEWQFSAEKEEGADQHEHSANDQQRPAKFAKSIHGAKCKFIVRRRQSPGARPRATGFSGGSDAMDQIHLLLRGFGTNREGIEQVEP